VENLQKKKKILQEKKKIRHTFPSHELLQSHFSSSRLLAERCHMMIMSFDVSQTTTINGGGNDDDDNDREGKLIANSFTLFSCRLALTEGNEC
jgi:hypothetical protein